MSYTDNDLRNFTQIAYADLNDGYEYLCAQNPNKNSFSIQEVANATAKINPNANIADLNCLTNQQKESWKISGIHDMNSVNGFYACIIETSPGEAAVGFRGSEAMNSLDNVQHDWINADLKLLNSTLTQQQVEVDKFLSQYQNQLDSYGSLSMAGHSLGGNLAEYATIRSSFFGLNDNVSLSASLDGPGFSNEFIEKYRVEIETMSSKMRHPRWSFVGTMLTDLPGVKYDFLSVSNKEGNDDYNMFTRHSTVYLDYDEYGNFIIGKQDAFSSTTSLITKGIDKLPKVVGDALITVIASTWITVMWANENAFDENGNLTMTGISIIAGIALFVAIIGVGPMLSAIGMIVLGILAVIVVAIAVEIIVETIHFVVDKICEALVDIYNWSKDMANKLYQSTVSLINQAMNWYNSNFNAGYRYATANPYFKVDTYKLTNYATRLANVNRRIINLDSRIDRLYWKIDLLDLWSLIQADALTGYSWRLQRCINYLNDTANDMATIERNVIANKVRT